ncbi:MAG: Uma2 family endonuclease [Lamprocystis purpurea]|jgi:Uma2 family endonuclease|uniref:Uma2 family endonuclease n=1 Tax=Lamprocystis purpurea TaxID=61598 RepID=UPI00037C2C78|nr:Uma2 family endonuclease [Lamprocystis purpurea]MBV5274169.1 Uma2 family endonuclease [Lamprocystis purpurea]
MSNTALRMPSLPTEDDLPCDDGEPMETLRHRLQMELLIHSLDPWAQARGDCFVGGNMFLYFSSEQVRGKDFRGPDFFVVLGVSPRERKSWVVWDEEKGPDLIVELLSESTAHTDKTEKKRIYQDRLRVAEYFWYDPWTPEDFAGFTLTDGRYRPLLPRTVGRIPSPLLGLDLCWWDGSYGGVETRWIRWSTPDGQLLPTAAEAAIAAAEVARLEADAAKAGAEVEKSKAEVAKSEAELAKSEAEVAKAKAELAKSEAEAANSAAEAAKLEAQAAKSQAATAIRQLDAEAERAAAAEARARAAEAELARLRMRLPDSAR